MKKRNKKKVKKEAVSLEAVEEDLAGVVIKMTNLKIVKEPLNRKVSQNLNLLEVQMKRKKKFLIKLKNKRSRLLSR